MANGPAISIEVAGLTELVNKLEALPRELVSKGAANPVAQSLRAAGKPIQLDAKRMAARAKQPYKVYTSRGVFTVSPGRLQSSVQIVRLRRPIKGNNESFVIKPLSRAIRKRLGVGVNYWSLIEFGMPGRGIAARPFLRPAVDAHKSDFFMTFGRQLGQRIDRIAARMGRTK